MKTVMKNVFVGVVVFFAFICGAQEPGELSYNNQLNALKGDAAAVLALLPIATTQAETNSCYFVAVSSMPKENRLAFIESVSSNLSENVYLRLKVGSIPRGELCNELLVRLHGFNWMLPLYWQKFDTTVATKEQCIAFYELVLKNVELNEHSSAALSKVKGELLKLKGL